MFSHLLRLSMITITTAVVWGCVEISTTVDFQDTLTKTQTIKKLGTEKKYSVSEGSELDGNMVLALQQKKTCTIKKRKISDRKMVTVRKVYPSERWKIPVLYALGVVGTSLLITGLAMDGPFERKLSEEERLASEDPDVDSEPTAKGALTVIGAITAPALPWALIETARTADTKKNLGSVSKDVHIGEQDCHAGPVVDEVMLLIRG